ncbi:MAG TPA: V-type ATP synthase subunit F [Anaerolineae bacterium]|jgi:V/A-type H+-transporting ATPase subunit F|nr:V-type ATP synthase subunit F [Anaerolineae bacterium]
MKLMVIGNQDAVWGFALAGVRGRIVTTAEELNRALDAAMADKEVGIVLVTEDAANLARQRVDTAMVRSTVPLVVEIPGPAGPRPDRPPLSEVIRRTIGVRI